MEIKTEMRPEDQPGTAIMAEAPKPVRIIRASRKEYAYVMISRATAQDRSLSWAARGVLAYLLSKPDDWQVDVEDLQQGCGRDKVYSLLAELIAAGYLKRVAVRSGGGAFGGCDYLVHEVPVPETPDTAGPVPVQPEQTDKRESQIRDSSLDAAHQGGVGLAKSADITESRLPASTLTPDHSRWVELDTLCVPEGYVIRWAMDYLDLVPPTGYGVYRKVGHLVSRGKKRALCGKRPHDEVLPHKATERTPGELWCLCPECGRIVVEGSKLDLTPLQCAIGTHLLKQTSEPTMTANLPYLNKLQRVMLTAQGYAPGRMPTLDESQRLADAFTRRFVPWYRAEFHSRFGKDGALPTSDIKLAKWYGEWISCGQPGTQVPKPPNKPDSSCSQCHGLDLVDYIIEIPGAAPRPVKPGEDLSLFLRSEQYAQVCNCMKGELK